MQPLAAGGQLIGFGWEARRDEAGRESTRTSKHDVGKNRQRWPRLEGPRGYGLASPASTCPLCGGGGGGGFGGLGGGGLGGLGCRMATRKVK